MRSTRSRHSRVMFMCAPAVLVAAATAFAPIAAHAQCVGHIVDPEQGYAFTPDGFTDTVAGVVAWDPDGDGPIAPWTVFNGTFRRAATAIGNGMVAFDGRSWSGFDLPDSLGATPGVRQTFVHEGTLYAVNAMFDDAVGSARVWRRWDGSAWTPVGPLVVNTTDSASNPARVVSFNGDIIAIGLSGYNTGASSPPPLSLLARQNFSQNVLWEPAGPPVTEFSGTVRVAVVGAGSLYIGGTLSGVGVDGAISNIARWDGTQMHALGTGVNSQVTDIFVDGANVYVTGAFTQAGDLPMAGVGVWNGSTWQQVGDGSLANTQSVAVHDGVVYVVARQGTFDNVYRLEGGQWMIDARTDLAAPPSTTAAPSLVSLEVANGELYMMGRFRGVNARAMQAAAVRLDEPVGPIGAVWKSVSGGFNTPIQSMVRYGNRVLAQGSFTRAGTEFAPGVGEWDGQRWSKSSVPTPPGTPGALAMMVDVNDALYALARNPARVFEFDGEAWIQMGGAITSEDGTSVLPMHLAEVQGDLYLTVSAPFGAPTAAGVRLQRWSGTQWEGVGGVIMRDGGTPSSLSVAVVQDQLYLSYYADTLDGQPFTGGLLRWDGQTLTPVQHSGSAPLELLSSGDTLEAIRAFTDEGRTQYVSAELSGSEWITTGRLPSSPTSYFLSRFTPIGDERYALISVSSSPSAVVVARLDREAELWVPISDTVSLPISTLPEQPGTSWSTNPLLTPLGTELHLYGAFSRIGDQAAVHWARFTTNGVPLIVEQPADVAASCGGPVSLRVGVANGYDDEGALEYQWYRNGVPLSETQFTRGVNTDMLFIPALQQPFTGSYSVTVTGACGTATSREAFVTGDAPECQACSPCAADFDFDGGVTGADMTAFIAAFEASAPCADVDQDGGVTGGDIGAFFALFEAGGC